MLAACWSFTAVDQARLAGYPINRALTACRTGHLRWQRQAGQGIPLLTGSGPTLMPSGCLRPAYLTDSGPIALSERKRWSGCLTNRSLGCIRESPHKGHVRFG